MIKVVGFGYQTTRPGSANAANRAGSYIMESRW